MELKPTNQLPDRQLGRKLHFQKVYNYELIRPIWVEVKAVPITSRSINFSFDILCRYIKKVVILSG